MINIKVFDPFGLCKGKLDERGWTEVAEGTTLGEAVKWLGFSMVVSKILMVRLNGEKLPFDTQLKDGDAIGYFSLVSGG
jgi:molybdopterin converting factor small subunit